MYANSNQQMIEAQASIITKLNEEIKTLHKRNDTLASLVEHYRPSAEFYKSLQEQITKNETLQSAWEEFLIVLRLACDDEYIKNPRSTASD